jgi:hypothetical protein
VIAVEVVGVVVDVLVVVVLDEVVEVLVEVVVVSDPASAVEPPADMPNPPIDTAITANATAPQLRCLLPIGGMLLARNCDAAVRARQSIAASSTSQCSSSAVATFN